MPQLDYLLKVKPDLIRVGMAIERAAKVAAPIFKANGWRWAQAEFGVPVEYEIAGELQRLANALYHSNADITGCGRLTAQRFQMDGADELRFFLDLAQEDVAKVPEDWYAPRDLPRSALEALLEGARQYVWSVEAGSPDTAGQYALFRDAINTIDRARGVYVARDTEGADGVYKGVVLPVAGHSPTRRKVGDFGYRTCGHEDDGE